jgi:hypothetical protein
MGVNGLLVKLGATAPAGLLSKGHRMNTSLRTLGIALALSILPATAVHAQISVGIQIGLPGAQIGVNMPSYPILVAVPGYPVYYAPQASANYFFYDGLYWVYVDDNWYASSWYNGPWALTSRDYVPLFVLRIPVRYYRLPPPYFSGWRVDAPPRWDEHWGRDWAQRRPGWDRWDRRQVPAAAPLPRYQQKYPGDRYPDTPERQRSIRSEHDRYVPREAVSRQHLKEPAPVVQRRAEPAPPPRSPSRDSREPVRRVEPRANDVPSQKSSPNKAQSERDCQPGSPGCRAAPPDRKAPGRGPADEERNRGRN